MEGVSACVCALMCGHRWREIRWRHFCLGVCVSVQVEGRQVHYYSCVCAHTWWEVGQGCLTWQGTGCGCTGGGVGCQALQSSQ